MEQEEIEKIFRGSGIDLDDRTLLPIAFSHIARKRKSFFDDKEYFIEKVCSEEFDELSKRLDLSGLQVSCSVRNNLLTRRLSSLIIKEGGEIDFPVLDQIITLLQKHLYSLGQDRQYDSKRQEHIVKILLMLQQDKELQKLLLKIDRPYSNRGADQIIRDTMQVKDSVYVDDTLVRRAALSSLLVYLRQTVGSCFATAPAIVVHDEQPNQFLKDLIDLLNTGRLTRTFEGVEYTAPLSVSSGAGDLKRNFLIGRDINESEYEIWQSPGLINAFVAIGVLEKEDSLPKRRETLKTLMQEAINTSDIQGERFYLSVEQIIRLVCLTHFSLTEKELQEVQNRPIGMIQPGLMMQVSKPGKKEEGIGRKCEKFLKSIEMAHAVFKGLADNALLKAWEFTLATFTETKANFSKWNLYISLGLGPEDRDGIGEKLLEILKRKLEEENRKMHEYQQDYENVYAQLKMLEGRMRRADETSAKWLKSEYLSTRNEFNTLEELRNRCHHRAESFANLFDVLIDMYLKLFPQYFQEVYDADMHHYQTGPYDDSPAGFQLIYKHGRATSALWTPVHNLQEFVEVLSAFFISTEHDIVYDPIMKGFEPDLTEIISSIITHVKSPEFLESALYRMAKAKGGRLPENPLENLDKVEKKPWAYTSGGSLETLIQCYFRLENKPDHTNRWIENQSELLVFLLDTMKELAPKEQEEFISNPNRSMLMTSPTHAFLLKPGFQLFKKGWESEDYTYIWCRDKIIHPMQRFIDRISLDKEMVEYLLEKIMQKIPKRYHHSFRQLFRTPPRNVGSAQLQEYITRTIGKDNELSHLQRNILHPVEIEALFYRLLPLFPIRKLDKRVKDIFQSLPDVSESFVNELMENYDRLKKAVRVPGIISAQGLRNICKAALCITLNKTTSEIDYPTLINHAAQELGYGMPRPIIFADSNWVKEVFGFVVSPGTGELELWRLDDTGTIGHPMRTWKHWLDGSTKEPPWDVYPKIYQYVF